MKAKHKKLLAVLLTMVLCLPMLAEFKTAHAAEQPGKHGWLAEMTRGETAEFGLKNADGWNASWQSSDKKIATVTKKGRVTAQKAGETTISATLTKKGKKDIVLKKKLTVKNTLAGMIKRAELQAANGEIVVRGFDWGPGVDEVVFTLPKQVSRVEAEDAVIETKNVVRTVESAFLCDRNGNKADVERSKFVAFTLTTDSTTSGSPFDYDFEKTFMNSWTPDYPLRASFATTRGGKTVTVGYSGNCGNKTNIISPDTSEWIRLAAHSATYKNPFSMLDETVTLQRAAYEPEILKSDGQKNPLIIWLHGQGEGGTDPDIVLLGNKVSALAKEDIQQHFTTTYGQRGAYVYVVQSPTYWMDEGDGKNGTGDNKSRYTEALMDAIKTYVESNPDIDTSRIYLTGCSNGGYMTMNMLIRYPDYFAAAIPNCEAYAFDRVSTAGNGTAMGGENETESTGKRWLTDKKINKIKDIPIWFLASANDTIVPPASYELPTYQALLQAGATNCWFSYYDQVRMSDDPAAEVMGHWVWVYFFNDQVTDVQDQSAIKDSADTAGFGFAPTATGGAQKATVDGQVYEDCFEWLNAQKK